MKPLLALGRLLVGTTLVCAAGWWTYPLGLTLPDNGWPPFMRQVAWGQAILYGVCDWRLLHALALAISFDWYALGLSPRLLRRYLAVTAFLLIWTVVMLGGAFGHFQVLPALGQSWLRFVAASLGVLAVCSWALDARLLIQERLLRATDVRLDVHRSRTRD